MHNLVGGRLIMDGNLGDIDVKIILNYNKLFSTSKLQTCLSFLSTKVEQRPEP